MLLKKLFACAALSLAATVMISAQDAAPRDVQDLVGARAAGGETQLRSRGYTFIKTEDGDDRKYSNYWKQSTRTCINVVTMNGRYDSISTVPAFDCNRGDNNESDNTPPANQNTPRDVRDLIGARASSGESQLRSRGYAFVKTEEGGDRKYSNYWKRSTRTCINVVTMNGRYDSIMSVPAFDCNGGNESSETAAPAAWAIGTFYGTGPKGERITLTINRDGSASALINNQTYTGTSSGTYLTIGGARSELIRQGNGFVTRRVDNGERITYSRNRWGNSGDASAAVDVSDLVGARASSGESEMRSRGFRNVDGFKSGNTSYTIWWRPQSRQCIQVATANGRYDSVTDIQTHPKCR